MAAKAAKLSKASRPATSGPVKAPKAAAHPKSVKSPGSRKAAAKPVATAQEILKHVKPAKVDATMDTAAPKAAAGKGARKGKAPKVQLTAKQILKAAKPGKVEANQDALEPQPRRAADILKELRKENFEFRHAQSKTTFDPNSFGEFFAAEIEAEVARAATINNDRFARWRCQCCDVVIPVPRRTTVLHGDYVLEHDDVLGLIVNGERWVPRAETPLEVVQPGRLRNPWTGRTIEGRDLGTTGAY